MTRGIDPTGSLPREWRTRLGRIVPERRGIAAHAPFEEAFGDHPETNPPGS